MVDIPLSQIDGKAEEFKAAVAAHIKNLTAFSKVVGKPRPTAPALVEAAIKRVQGKNSPDTFLPDYTFVDDAPVVPELSFEDKKNLLYAELQRAEIAAKNQVISPRKLRLVEIQRMDAVNKDEKVRTTEDNEIIASYEDLNNRWRQVSRIAAQAESDIEDLTEENLASWQMPNFEGI